jgi:hypothetical protein
MHAQGIEGVRSSHDSGRSEREAPDSPVGHSCPMRPKRYLGLEDCGSLPAMTMTRPWFFNPGSKFYMICRSSRAYFSITPMFA